MKNIKTFNESKIAKLNSVPLEDLENRIYDIMCNELELRDIPYGDGQVEIDDKSIMLAAKKIIEYLNKV